MIITSLSNPLIKKIMGLKTKKNRIINHQYLVEGKHMVEEALLSGVVDMVITTDKNVKDATIVNENIMKKIAFTKNPQPYMAICHKCKSYLDTENKRTLILDDIQDPGNLGTLIRTALAFGFNQIVLSEDTVDVYNDKVLRATQGAIYRVNIVNGALERIIPELQKSGVYVAASTLDDASNIDSIENYDKMAIVLGNEGNGMHAHIVELCNQSLYIPISNMESLNVAIAGGIIMYKYRK